MKHCTYSGYDILCVSQGIDSGSAARQRRCGSGSAVSAAQGVVSCSEAVSSQGSGSAARQRSSAAQGGGSGRVARQRISSTVAVAQSCQIGGSVVQRQHIGELGSAGRWQRQHSLAAQGLGSGSLACCRTRSEQNFAQNTRIRSGRSLAQNTSCDIFHSMQNTARAVFSSPFLRRHCNYKNKSRQQIKHT